MPYKDPKKKSEYMRKYEKVKRSGWGRVLIEALGPRCVRCLSVDDLELDHVIALRLGGEDKVVNLQVLCGKCHARKTQEERYGKRVAPPAPPQNPTHPMTTGTKTKTKVTTAVWCTRCGVYSSYQEWLREHAEHALLIPAKIEELDF